MKARRIYVRVTDLAGEFPVEIRQDAELEARKIIAEGYRRWDPRTQYAFFYPPHQIECVSIAYVDDSE